MGCQKHLSGILGKEGVIKKSPVKTGTERMLAGDLSNLSQLLNFLTSHPLFSAGDRVVSNRPHAEVACVPKSLYGRYA